MKNYLVKSLFQVSDPDWRVHDRSHEKNLYENYLEMHRVSLASYKKFLKGDWDFKFITGKVDNINQAFEKTFWGIHEIWHKEPCNILYTDPDTIAIRDIDVWDKHQHFKMFNHTDPKSHEKFPHFFNAGVRYFPSTMKEDIWNIGTTMAKDWDESTYDTEQIILNTMLWNQGVDIKDIIDPTLAYQALTMDTAISDAWNNCSIGQAKILHFHGSRDSESRVQVMTHLGQQLGVI